MTGPRAPVPTARLGVALAVRALPTRADRDRYYSEFVAELYGLPAAQQLRSTAGFLSQAFALRAALGARARPGEVPMSAPASAWHSFRCHVVRLHYWKTFSNPDGERYRACAVCHRERFPGIPPIPG